MGYHNFPGNVVAWGIEDPDWEYTRSSTDHNEYMGLFTKKNGEGERRFMNLGKSISLFCWGCHNRMRTQNEAADGSGTWFKHPSDQALPDTGEYDDYTTYDPLIPVGRPALTTVSPTVTPGTDMVMCLTCHRAHASPYPDMLRWDYAEMQAGGGTSGEGCFKCHTKKDDGV